MIKLGAEDTKTEVPRIQVRSSRGRTSVGCVEALACEIRSGLDDALSETALQVAVDVEPKLLELGQPRPRPGAPGRLTEVGQRRGKLTIRRQRDLVDV